MSGFVKRKQTVNTVNPAGGIRPSLEPNVGQYGWTKSDSAHVNQLIAYVNAAKEYAEQAKQGADFITGKIDDITDLYNKVIFMYDKVVPLATRIEFIYRNILTIQDDIDGKFEEIEKWHADINTWVVEVRTLHREAGEFSATASKAAIDAAESAQQASDIAEELRKGMVYRGTWNVEATSSYPPHGDTNSTWDVILNPGSLEFTWGGTTWYWGDRLIYLKDDNKYQQVESGTTVVSVNGKKGAVTLNAADIGAAAVVANKIVIPTGYSGGLGAEIKNQNIDTVIGLETWITTRSDGDSEHRAIGVGEKLGPVYWDGLRKRIYHEGFKPTASDVGALPLTGGVINGDLTVNGNLHAKNSVLVNTANVIGVDGSVARFGDSTYSREVRVAAKGGNLIVTPSSTTSYKVYHEGFKPTAADIGAFPITGGNIRGPVHAKSYVIAESLNGKNWTAIGATDDSLPWISANVNGTEKKIMEFDGNGETLFASNINVNGATSSSAWGTAFNSVGGKLRSDNTSFLSLDGNTYSFLTSPNHAHLCQNSYWNGADWLKYSTAQPSGHLFIADGELRFNHSVAGNLDPNQLQYRVYHGGFKPTAADVGAIPVLPWEDSPGTDANRLGNYVAFTYSRNAPHSGALASFGSSNYNMQFNTSYNKDSLLSFRTYNGDTKVWNSWSPVYHEGFKPTAADVGAVSKEGDNLRGGSTIRDYASGYLNLMGNQHGFFGGKVAGYLTCNAFFDGVWKKIDTSGVSTHIEVYNGSLNLYNSPAGSTNPAENKYVVYHEGHKPTPASIGAVSKSGDTFTGEVVIDVNSAAPFTLSRTSQVGIKFIVGGNTRYAGVDTDGNLRYGPNLDHATNYRVYHEGFKPTTFDIEYTNPRTKNVETLMDVIAELTSRIEALEKQIKENT